MIESNQHGPLGSKASDMAKHIMVEKLSSENKKRSSQRQKRWQEKQVQFEML